MCTTPLRRLSLSLLFAAAACHSGADPSPPFAPMPMGEVAQPQAVHQDTIEVIADERFDRQWNPTRDSRRLMSLAFQFTYHVSAGQELLAAQCVRANWEAAADVAQQVCDRADFFTLPGLVAGNRDLQQQLSDALFPCDGGRPLATVGKILWQKCLLQ